MLSQTLIFIFYFGPISDFFRQFSADVDYQMDLEEIVAIVAISTFLVGFSSVRLQSILDERKDAEARRIERVLEQNAGKDLLPLPTSLGEMAITKDQGFADRTTFLTNCLTWINFGVAFLLIRLHEVTSAVSSLPFWLVQVVHFGIVLIGSFGPGFARQQFIAYSNRQPFECYKKMMIEILNSLNGKVDKTKLIETIEDFDASVPEWSWLTLIRCSTLEEENDQQVKRIHDLVQPQKDGDDYSLIAFVWSSYLLHNDKYDSISRAVQYSDIQKILRFGNANMAVDGKDLSSEGTVEERFAAIQAFHKDPGPYERSLSFNNSDNRQTQARTFARLTVKEIAKVWSTQREFN